LRGGDWGGGCFSNKKKWYVVIVPEEGGVRICRKGEYAGKGIIL